MSSQPFCGDCPDREACSQGYPCVLVKDINGPDGERKVALYHNGRPVGVATTSPDDNEIVCKFDIKSLKVQEVIELFWVGHADQFEIRTL